MPWQRRASEASLAAAYPDLDPAQRQALLDEVASHYFVYEDYVSFREHRCGGKYLNVREAGFREAKNQGPWPPDPHNLNVFAFGGSTMFGWGLPDWQTIPSFLQEELSLYSRKPVCLYNFGTSNYYSTQERICLEQLLSKGLKPDIAIFLDGLNDFWMPQDNKDSWFRYETDNAFARSRKLTVSYLLSKLPLARAARKVRTLVTGQEVFASTATQEEIRQTIERFAATNSSPRRPAMPSGFRPCSSGSRSQATSATRRSIPSSMRVLGKVNRIKAQATP